ncbi:hypothetical protein H2201_009105 [Coniosporium apollinis]|uniref:Uncharacterized protein n=1 Tax=Coniosporium apollinis TaxID=61459 RepID=A0ABQ9NEQ2_9PEZI|nr:hypothetical protein H2201_009105 [Coniosporium apollinis]
MFQLPPIHLLGAQLSLYQLPRRHHHRVTHHSVNHDHIEHLHINHLHINQLLNQHLFNQPLFNQLHAYYFTSSRRWGWYSTPTTAQLSSGIGGPLYVGAGQNDISKATTFKYVNDAFTDSPAVMSFTTPGLKLPSCSAGKLYVIVHASVNTARSRSACPAPVAT